jgi:dsDNA-specific endonuclease/ATPase MutS2
MNIMDLTPSSNKDEVTFSLKETDEARESTVKLGKLDIFPFDIHDTLNRLRMSAPLNVHEFLEIFKFVDDIARVMTYEKKIQNAKIDYTNLKRTFESIVSLKRIKDLIVKVIDFDYKTIRNYKASSWDGHEIKTK